MTEKHNAPEHKTLYAAGLPLPIDPETGKIDLDKLTDEQRAELADAGTKLANAMQETIAPNIERIKDLILPDAAKKLQEWEKITKPYQELYSDLEELEPFIKAELQKDEYNGLTYEQLIDSHTLGELLIMRRDPGSVLSKVIEAAKEAQKTQLPQVKYNTGTELKTGTGKINTVFYSITAPKPKNYISGQREMLNIPREDLTPLKYEKTGTEEITLFYDFFPNEYELRKLGIGHKFDSYDFFISAIIDNLYLEGNKIVSLTKIWRELGNTASPSQERLTDLYKRIVRGLTTIVTIDDRDVQQAWRNDPGDEYNEIISPLMPVQIHGKKFIANGNVAKAQIQINEISPLFALSHSIGQFTTWKKEILQLYTGRKTPRYYSIMQFLMVQIAWMRNPHSKRNNKITYESLYLYTGDTGTRKQQLARDMMYRLLDEVFIPAGYIKSYKEDSSGEIGVKIKVTKNAGALPDNEKK